MLRVLDPIPEFLSNVSNGRTQFLSSCGMSCVFWIRNSGIGCSFLSSLETAGFFSFWTQELRNWVLYKKLNSMTILDSRFSNASNVIPNSWVPVECFEWWIKFRSSCGMSCVFWIRISGLGCSFLSSLDIAGVFLKVFELRNSEIGFGKKNNSRVN